MTAIRTAAYAALVSILPLAGAAFAQNQSADPAGQAQSAGDKQKADGSVADTMCSKCGVALTAGDKQKADGSGTATVCAKCAAAQTAGDMQMSVEQATADWEAGPKKAAKAMQEKYGEPNGATPTRLVWTDKGPFKEIILLNEEINHDFPMPHKDYLQHVVSFDVPTDKVGELAEFDGSIIVDRTRGTIGARCDTEAHNLLALNLAWDIINGKKDVEQARKAYGQIAMKAKKQGEMDSYMKDLQFQPMAKAGDSDVVTVGPKAGEAQPAAAQE